MLNDVAMGRIYSVLAEYNLTMQQFNALNIYTSGKLVEMLGQPGRNKEEDRQFLQVNILFIVPALILNPVFSTVTFLL
jgi:hypothetical protein